MSNSFWPHGLQHARLPCPLSTPRVYSNSMFIKSLMPSNHLILCHPLLLLPSIFPSIRVLSNESALHIRWPKYWSYSFNMSSSNEYTGLISFRIFWFALLLPKSLLQHHSLKVSAPWTAWLLLGEHICKCSFMDTLSYCARVLE